MTILIILTALTLIALVVTLIRVEAVIRLANDASKHIRVLCDATGELISASECVLNAIHTLDVVHEQGQQLHSLCSVTRAIADTSTEALEIVKRIDGINSLNSEEMSAESHRKALEAIERMNSGIANILNYDGMAHKDGE